MSTIWGQGASQRSAGGVGEPTQQPMPLERSIIRGGDKSPPHTRTVTADNPRPTFLFPPKTAASPAPQSSSSQIESTTVINQPVKRAWSNLLDQCRAKLAQLDFESTPLRALKSGSVSKENATKKVAPPVVPDAELGAREVPSVFRQWSDVIQAARLAEEQAKAEAFLLRVANIGIAQPLAAQRERLLQMLQTFLRDTSREPQRYRQAVEWLLKNCRSDEQDTARACARDYYYFWLGDLRNHPGSVVASDLEISSMRALRTAPFESLIQCMKREPGHCSLPALDFYLGQQFENGLCSEELSSREQMLKALLVLLRGRTFLPNSYRNAVDKLLHISPTIDRGRVVGLAREFFYYWIAFPPAATRNLS